MSKIGLLQSVGEETERFGERVGWFQEGHAVEAISRG